MLVSVIGDPIGPEEVHVIWKPRKAWHAMCQRSLQNRPVRVT
jgi:hypothetical protein